MKIRDRIFSGLCLAVLTFFLIVFTIPAAQSSTTINSSLSTAIENENPEKLLDRGRVLYEAEQFAEAATVWQQAAWAFAKQQDFAGQAWSLSYLSFAQQTLGRWEQAETTISHSIELLKRSPSEPAIQAQVFNILGHLQNSTGRTEAAILTWQQAEASYSSSGDRQGVLGSKINQSQALRRLGQYRQAEKIINNLQQELQEQSDSRFKVEGLRNLGVALQASRKLTKSQAVLKESLAIANKLDPPLNTSSILFSLGNISREAKDLTKALEYYKLAAKNTTKSQVKLDSQLNLLRLYIQLEESEQAIALTSEIKSKLNQLLPSRVSVYAAVNFAESLEQLETLVQKPGSVDSERYFLMAKEILTNAIDQTKVLQDTHAQALVLTQLGQLLSHKQQTKALEVTTEALHIAQQINALEIIARAAWQIGKLQKQLGNTNQATVAYELAFDTLQILRSDLTAISAEDQFSFTETIEPIYRQLVSLLLTPIQPGKQVAETKLKEAREVIEALQLAELDDFFHEACLNAQSVPLEDIDREAAVIYPIILSNRLEVIVSIPGKPLHNYTTYKNQAEIESVLQRMRQSLNPAYSRNERLELYQQAYSWLIEPTASQLEDANIKTLVFVLDGSLRNLPMTALYDGKQYLLEKYSTVISPGLQLLQPQNIVDRKVQAIAAGVSESNQGYQALPGVEQELIKINNQIQSKILLNQDFTQNNLQRTVAESSFSILHLATHGKFSSNVEDTFILAWNGKINVKEFDRLIRSKGASQSNRIELLVLSACQTAQGDPKATLGLAGLAVRSGASSTLGTLWAVRDLSTTKLMGEFYQNLGRPGVTRAEALRRAQLSLLKGEYSDPLYWAAFVLVGNWS